MASIADMLIQSTAQKTGDVPDITGSIQRGAALGQQIQQVQQQREMIEERKQQLQMQKVEKVMNAFEAGTKFEDKAAQSAYFKNYLPNMIKALKVEDVFNPELMQFVQQSPEVRDKVLGLKLDIQQKIQDGTLKGAAILNYAKDRLTPEELANFDGKALLEQQKFAFAESQKAQRAQTVAGAASARQEADIESTGRKTLARETAQQFADYAGGGKQKFNAALSKLEDAALSLETGKVKTGRATNQIPGFKSDDVQSMLNPQMVAAKSAAQSALNETLRQTLGAQFTEQEGVRILNQIWDDRQPPAENAKRLRAKIGELSRTIKDKEALFKSQGFKLPGEDSVKFKPNASQIERFKKLSTTEKDRALKALADRFQITVEEAKKAFGE